MEGKSKTMYFVIGVILLILIGGGVYLLRSQKSSVQPPTVIPQVIPNTPSTQSNQITPAISPITRDNVDQTLNNTDAAMQQSMNQANTDLNDVNSIDKSQDTSGL